MGYNFFLYGAYGEGQSCYGRFKNFIKSTKPAFVKASIYQLKCGMPLLVNQGETLVSGQAVELDFAESQWPIIDALNGFYALAPEKSFILREIVVATGLEGEPISLQTYCLNPLKKNQTLGEVTSTELEKMSETSLIQHLTERQKTYIYKLSRAKGREIVPIDMALYRELISLELIVDKGRRLALTNLGQEISHFL
jgi:hypothetical protein